MIIIFRNFLLIQILKYNFKIRMQASKTKRVFQLRKTGSVRQPTNQQSRVIDQEEPQSVPENEKVSNREQVISANESYRIENNQSARQQETVLVSHPEITIDQQELHFYEKICNVQVKNIKVTNIGSSAIYFEWNFKNLPKLNANAIKDPKPNFYCHYQPNVIKPGEEEIFSFSFFSETPGVFVQQIELVCQPEPATPISPIRLKGIAYIEDTLQQERAKLAHELKERATEAFTKQVLSDIVNQVKSPVPPLPDVSNPQIAERQFQLMNLTERLYYNNQVHKWFNSLYHDICNACQILEESRHWDQSVATLANLIAKVKDPILQQSFDKRLQNYKSLSCTRPPQKSDLFPKIKQFLLQTGYALGGSIADESKKELQMWQIPFEQPSETQTEQEVAAKKDQRAKLIAEWAKKMKKKKWGPEEQNQMLNNYRGKLEKGVSKTLIQKFDGFDGQANFQICEAKMKQKFEPQKYFDFLQRFKTVEEYPIQGKKILLKFDLKLKQNSQEALLKLDEYLKKKKEEELRLEEQKKNQEASKAKKKAPPPKKKKGQKQQEEQKILTYDFNTLLDQQSWEGLVSTLKFIVEKQPLLLIIGISFGPKVGVFRQKESVKFLLEPLKAIEPSIQFLQHKDLLGLKQKIAQQTLNEGSIYLTENLSFLPCEGMEKGHVKVVQKVENGEQKKIQVVESQKMLMSEVESQLEELMPAIDLVVREDRFVNRVSGICSYGKRLSILGLAWWKYIAFALRTKGSAFLLGGGFSAQKLVLVERLTKYSGKVHLAGELGIKIWMATQGIESFFGVKNTKNEQNFIKYFLDCQKGKDNLVLPCDFILIQSKEDQKTRIDFQVGHKLEPNDHIKVVDIGNNSCQEILKIKSGHFFLIDYPSVNKQSTISLEKICKSLYVKKEEKKERHQHEQSSPAGINYEKDLVIYLVGLEESDLQKIELKQKKARKKEGEEEEEQEEPEPEEEVKRIDQVCDFRINDTQYFLKLLSAEFSYGLKDVSRYPKSD